MVTPSWWWDPASQPASQSGVTDHHPVVPELSTNLDRFRSRFRSARHRTRTEANGLSLLCGRPFGCSRFSHGVSGRGVCVAADRTQQYGAAPLERVFVCRTRTRTSIMSTFIHSHDADAETARRDNDGGSGCAVCSLAPHTQNLKTTQRMLRPAVSHVERILRNMS